MFSLKHTGRLLQRYIFMYIYVCIYICIYIYIIIYIYTYTYMCIYTYIYMYIFAAFCKDLFTQILYNYCVYVHLHRYVLWTFMSTLRSKNCMWLAAHKQAETVFVCMCVPCACVPVLLPVPVCVHVCVCVFVFICLVCMHTICVLYASIWICLSSYLSVSVCLFYTPKQSALSHPETQRPTSVVQMNIATYVI